MIKITVTEDSWWVPGARMKEWYACKKTSTKEFLGSEHFCILTTLNIYTCVKTHRVYTSPKVTLPVCLVFK